MGVTCGVRKNLICNETICTKISCTMFIHFCAAAICCRAWKIDALCEFEKSVAVVLACWITPKNPGSFPLQMIHQTPGRLHLSCMPFYIQNMCSVFHDLEISSEEARGEVTSTDVCCCGFTSFLNGARQSETLSRRPPS